MLWTRWADIKKSPKKSEEGLEIACCTCYDMKPWYMKSLLFLQGKGH
jgi:hypothetical protein